MEKIKTYKQLKVWQRAMEFMEEIYKIVKRLPKFELYLLVSQVIRSAISIPANIIAEGWAGNYYKDGFRDF